MEVKKKNIDVRDQVSGYLKERGVTLAWLSEKLDINYNTLYSTLIQKSISLSDERLNKVNEILGTDFKNIK